MSAQDARDIIEVLREEIEDKPRGAWTRTAETLGTTSQSLHAVLSGRQAPSIITIARIADVLGFRLQVVRR